MIKLEDALTDEEIYGVAKNKPNFPEQVRACIALAVEKWPEKVSGFLHDDGDVLDDDDLTSSTYRVYERPEGSNARHALLLLGPKYEPAKKPCPTCGELKHSGRRWT